MNVDEGLTLRTLIVGKSNRRAFERIQQSLRKRRAQAPMLLLGPSGVGKSHLLQVAANHQARRGKRVLVLRAHEFRERYVACIRETHVAELRSWMRAHDVLVVDELSSATQPSEARSNRPLGLDDSQRLRRPRTRCTG